MVMLGCGFLLHPETNKVAEGEDVRLVRVAILKGKDLSVFIRVEGRKLSRCKGRYLVYEGIGEVGNESLLGPN